MPTTPADRAGARVDCFPANAVTLGANAIAGNNAGINVTANFGMIPVDGDGSNGRGDGTGLILTTALPGTNGPNDADLVGDVSLDTFMVDIPTVDILVQADHA